MELYHGLLKTSKIRALIFIKCNNFATFFAAIDTKIMVTVRAYRSLMRLKVRLSPIFYFLKMRNSDNHSDATLPKADAKIGIVQERDDERRKK